MRYALMKFQITNKCLPVYLVYTQLVPIQIIMEDFRFTTKEPLATNADTMDWFSNELFYKVFDENAIFTEDEGSYAEVLDGKGQKWALHASNDGDFVNHKIKFEALS